MNVVVLTEDDAAPGHAIVHLDPGCPVVRDHRANNRMLATLVGVDLKRMPSWVRLHNCKDKG